jgi:hypothetical protein
MAASRPSAMAERSVRERGREGRGFNEFIGGGPFTRKSAGLVRKFAEKT